MGFTTMSIASMVATAAQSAVAYQSNKEQSKQLTAIADQELQDGKDYANSLTNTALNNNSRAMKNMNNEVGKARLDASASNLASSGSVFHREQDLTTRLQDQISNNTQSTLQQANLAYATAVNNANSTYQSAQAAKTNSVANVISGAGSLFNQIGSYSLNSAKLKSEASQNKNNNNIWSL